MHHEQNQGSLLVKRRNDSCSPGPLIRKQSLLALTRDANLATEASDEIRESGRAFQSLMVWGKKLPL